MRYIFSHYLNFISALRGPLSLSYVCVTLLISASAWAGNPPVGGGGTCTGQTHADGSQGQQVAFNNGLYTCSGGVWVQQAIVIGSKSQDGTAASCSATTEGAIRYNSTSKNIEFCNASAWTAVPAAATSCSAPSGLSFTNLTGQSLSAVVSSSPATITFTGCSGSYTASVTGAATAQISINGGAWGTTGAISSGQTLQVRMTTSPSASTTLTATVTVNATSTNWTTTTRSGSLQIFSTTNLYGGNLGGLSGADTICQNEAGTLGYAGTYKALLSTSAVNAKDRLTLTYPIIRASDGVTVSSSNLWNASLSNAVAASGSAAAWTGSNTDGTKSSTTTCSDWTTGSSGVGEYGGSNFVDLKWITNSQAPCTVTAALFCVQQ